MALSLPGSAIRLSKKTQEVYLKGCLMVQEEDNMAAEDVKGLKIQDTRFYSRILESSKK